MKAATSADFEPWPWCLLFGVLAAAVLYVLVLGVLAVSG